MIELDQALHWAFLSVLPTIQVITNLVKMVKARDIRRPFCPAGHWLSEEVNIRADKVLGCVERMGLLGVLLTLLVFSTSANWEDGGRI